MDLPSIQEVKLDKISTSNNSTTQLNTAPDVAPDPNPTPKIPHSGQVRSSPSDAEKPIHSASAYLSIYQMGKLQNMKQISSLTSEDCYINM